MKKRETCGLACLLAFAVLVATGCDNGSNPIETEVKEYTVTFNSDGGGGYEAQKVKENKTVAKPEQDPVKNGFDFLAWYLADDVFDFNTPITKDITLTAKYVRVDIFAFDADTGTITGFTQIGFDEKIAELTIPARIKGTSVTAIGNDAFNTAYTTNSESEMTKLTGLELPDTITSIGQNAFAGNSLTEVTIPDSVTEFGGNSPFSKNPVETAVIGKGITDIPAQLFAGNPAPSITSITIKGENVTIPTGYDNTILNVLNALGVYHVSFTTYYGYAKQGAGTYTTEDGKTWKKDGQAIQEPKVDLSYDFASAGSFVQGTDYETAAGSWEVKNGRLYFDNNNNDAKLKFLKSPDMANSIIEMDISIGNVYGENGSSGNGGPVLHMDRIGEAGDALDGYYVGTGKKGDGPNYHFESAWFGFDSGWHDLWNSEDTNIPKSDEYLHLVLTVIDRQANLKVYDKNGELKRELDGNTSDGRGAPPDSGFAGIRVWNCAGWIDNVKITNAGDGLDFNN